MTHVQIDHSVLGVGPYDGEITEINHVLYAQWIVFRGNGKKYFYVFIGSRTGVPLIPLT